jgi:hypothetical protein
MSIEEVKYMLFRPAMFGLVFAAGFAISFWLRPLSLIVTGGAQ